MAIKETNKEKTNRLVQVLTTDYKWENLLLGVLATISSALALIIIINQGPLYINADFPILGARTSQLIFSWVLLAISLFGIVIVLSPYFSNAYPEIKKINWPNKPQFFDHLVRVLIFMLILAGFIVLFDLVAKSFVSLVGGN